jgi:hypothetical protein
MFTIEALPADVAARLRADATIVRVADKSPGFPCRQCLRDAEVGEELVLVAYDPFDGLGDDSPYRAPGAIFLHRDDCSAELDRSTVPDQLVRRQLSLRTFDAAAMMLDGRVVEGHDLADALDEVLGLPGAERAHIHNAGAGCFAAVAHR